MNTTLHTHRNQVQWASGLNFLVGIWLFVSAFVIYARGPMVTNNVVLGIAVAVLAIIRAAGAYGQAWISWLNALLGVWVVISPWAVMGTGRAGPTVGMITCNVITGAVIVILGCWSATATTTEPAGVTYPDNTRPSLGH